MTGDVLLLLFAFFITGTEPRNSLSDGVEASQNFLPCQTVLSRVESFLHIFLTFTIILLMMTILPGRKDVSMLGQML